MTDDNIPPKPPVTPPQQPPEIHLAAQPPVQPPVAETFNFDIKPKSSAANSATKAAEAVEKPGFFSRALRGLRDTPEAVKTTYSQSGKIGKFGRAITTGVGAVMVWEGAKNISAGLSGHQQDELGNEVPADMGNLVTGVSQLTAGAAAVYLSSIRAGMKSLHR